MPDLPFVKAEQRPEKYMTESHQTKDNVGSKPKKVQKEYHSDASRSPLKSADFIGK